MIAFTQANVMDQAIREVGFILITVLILTGVIQILVVLIRRRK